MNDIGQIQFREFKKACEKQIKNNDEIIVIIPRHVLQDANRIFKIDKSKNALLKFIVDFQYSELNYLKRKELIKNNEYPPPIWVFDYEFLYKFENGYLAFYYSSKSKVWRLKSFHEQRDL